MPGSMAARLLDPHVCPMVTGIVPHVGGPVLPPFQITVITGKMIQARVSDMLTCVGPPDAFAKGSVGVHVVGLPAARALIDLTVHGGNVVMGCPTVFIGESLPAGGGGGGGGMATAAISSGTGMLSAALGSAAAYIAPWKQALAYKNAAKAGAPFCERCGQ